MSQFVTYGFNEKIVAGLSKGRITEPTDIQCLVLPKALLNEDVIAESVTGSGKTLAYLIPIFQKINPEQRENQAMIIAPTHELAAQIMNEIKKLATNAEMPITFMMAIGDTSVQRQVEALKQKPHIIVGSPGRIRELITLKKIKSHTVKTIVLDEVDRLIEDEKLEDIQAIIKTTQKDRQLMAFSASIKTKPETILTAMMKEPFIARLKGMSVNPNIEHFFILVEQRDKIDMVRKIAHAINPEQMLVFLNKNQLIQDMDQRLKHHTINAKALFGAGERNERKEAMQGFLSGKVQVLIASDLAARGLDIPQLKVVVCADISKHPEEYLHRAGRTARYKGKGIAISLITTQEIPYLTKLAKDLDIFIAEKKLVSGALVDVKKSY